MMDMRKKRFSPVLLLAVFAITLCGTTAFALTPVPAVVAASKHLQQSQTGTASTIKSSPAAAPSIDDTGIKQDDLKGQGADESILSPNVLMPATESPQASTPQAQIYGPDFYQLVPGDNS